MLIDAIKGKVPRDAMGKILLIEDNEMNRDMLSRRLERKGFDVVIAVDGLAGVEMASSASPDLILMDLSLPVIDGWEATRRIKANAATQQIPVIALTAHAMAGDEQQALEAGCDDYETKPIDFKRLLGKIDNFLGAS
jgi:CheY-like chemotaxis protein